MGGNAAKERRRLKRLEQAKSAGDNSNTAPPAAVPHGTSDPNATITIERNVLSTSSAEKKLKPAKDTGVKRANGGIVHKPALDTTQATSQSKANTFNNGKRKHSKVNEGHGSNNRSSSFPKRKSNTQGEALPRAKKYKKPKHLARKIANNSDPEAMKEFEKLQEELVKVKAKRVDKFESKVVKMVGGKHLFDKEAFDNCINGGGTNLKTIVNVAAKIDGITGKHNVVPGNETKRKGWPLQKDKSFDSDRDKKTIKIAASVVDEQSVETNGKSERREAKVKVTKSYSSNEQGNKAQIVSSSSPENSDEKDDGKEKLPLPKTAKIAASVVDAQCIESNGKSERTEPKVNAIKSSCDSEQGKKAQIVSGSSPENSNEKDDVEESTLLPNARTRGRRRRGRVDADIKRDILNTQQEQNAIAAAVADTNPVSSDVPKKKPLKCFEVGKTYTGTVMYVKPQLGVFINIGCHSDAFCHISRISDGFVNTITDDVIKTGDVLENIVRVTDINRKGRKITVSLQSEDRIVDETASSRAWKERSDKRYEDKKGKKNSTSSNIVNSVQNNDLAHDNKDEIEPVTRELTYEIPVTPRNCGAENGDMKNDKRSDGDLNELDMSNMTPAEYKRARKLQRRAERRKQKEVTGE